jgi:ABC-type multidrug transport system fused ATPase/permease subunit
MQLRSGVTTIRAFGSETRFLKLNEEKIDSNHRAFFYLWTANRWLCFRTDIISAFVVTLAGAGVMTGQLGAGWAGLTMTYALDFTQALLVCAVPSLIV